MGIMNRRQASSNRMRRTGIMATGALSMMSIAAI